MLTSQKQFFVFARDLKAIFTINHSGIILSLCAREGRSVFSVIFPVYGKTCANSLDFVVANSSLSPLPVGKETQWSLFSYSQTCHLACASRKSQVASLLTSGLGPAVGDSQLKPHLKLIHSLFTFCGLWKFIKSECQSPNSSSQETEAEVLWV